jgi:hypothetical protein
MHGPRQARGLGSSCPEGHPGFGEHVSRHLLAIVTALLLVVMLAPAAFAADGEEPAPTDAAPTPTLVPEPTATPFDGNGEIVVDETFVTTPSSTPAGQVRGTTGRPQHTPPATDTITTPATHGTALQLLLALLAGGSLLALVAGLLPVPRPRRTGR